MKLVYLGKKIIWLVLLLATAGGGYRLYHHLTHKPPQPLFTSKKATKRPIAAVINATGGLEITQKIKVGSLITGTVRKIFVQENDQVKKGQQLALIDNGKSDTDVKEAEGNLVKAKATASFQEQFYPRQKALYESGQLARNLFEQYTRDFETAKADVAVFAAQLERKQIEYDNRSIKAPEAGIVINVGVAEGEGITTDLNSTVLFEIAQDLTKMQAKLEIDESDIGQIKKGQLVNFTVDTYAAKRFKGTVENVSYSGNLKKEALIYKAIVAVDNSELLLRPGMTVNAQIKVAKTKEALAVTNQVFQIDHDSIVAVAKKNGYKVQQLSDQEKKKIRKTSQMEQIKYLWVVKNDTFTERAVTINLSDDIYYEVTSGIAADDDIVIELNLPQEANAMYKKWFGSAF